MVERMARAEDAQLGAIGDQPPDLIERSRVVQPGGLVLVIPGPVPHSPAPYRSKARFPALQPRHSAPEGRQNVAHGASRGNGSATNPATNFQAPEGRQKALCRPSGAWEIEREVRWGGIRSFLVSPRLTPWATFCRPSGAKEPALCLQHRQQRE